MTLVTEMTGIIGKNFCINLPSQKRECKLNHIHHVIEIPEPLRIGFRFGVKDNNIILESPIENLFSLYKSTISKEDLSGKLKEILYLEKQGEDNKYYLIHPLLGKKNSSVEIEAFLKAWSIYAALLIATSQNFNPLKKEKVEFEKEVANYNSRANKKKTDFSMSLEEMPYVPKKENFEEVV